jgi:bifunctional non-homologous end joining protein LigD
MTWSGTRALARVEGGRIEVSSGDGADISAAVPELRALGEQLGSTQVVLDGVLVQFGADGRLDPTAVSGRIAAAGRRRRGVQPTEPVVYLLVDLLHLDGRSLLSEPYRVRRAQLDGLGLAGPAWQVPPMFEGTGRQALRTSAEQHLVGVIAKRLNSPYRPGEESADWIAVPSGG